MRKQQQKQAKKRLVIGAVLIVAVVAVVITLLVVNSNRSPESQTIPEVSQSRDEEKPEQETPKTPEPEVPKEDEDLKSIDPATVGTVDIVPASLTVSYIKGVGGFEYEVLRSADGRKYVELKNEQLVGTKCSQDTGVFVSILESPNESEKATVAKTTSLDGAEYGLSVASPTCTSDPDLLQQYQDAFSKPFGLLKKL